jgi:hypothetical protein
MADDEFLKAGAEFSDQLLDAFGLQMGEVFEDETRETSRYILINFLIICFVCGGYVVPARNQGAGGLNFEHLSQALLISALLIIQIYFLLIYSSRSYTEWSVWSFTYNHQAWKVLRLNDYLDERQSQLTKRSKALQEKVVESVGTPNAIAAAAELDADTKSGEWAMFRQNQADFTKFLTSVIRTRKLRLWVELVCPLLLGAVSIIVGATYIL